MFRLKIKTPLECTSLYIEKMYGHIFIYLYEVVFFIIEN
jgi:hypothetical protein